MRSGLVAWQVIDTFRRQGVTGELTLHAVDEQVPAARVYLRDGLVYLAERGTDPALGVRLLTQGVVTREQLHRGALVIGGVEHLGRLFEREPSVDRHAVELCVEMLTEQVLTEIALYEVRRHDLAVYRRHPSGIDRWAHVAAPPPSTEPVSGIVAATPAPSTAVVPVVAPVAAPVEPIAPAPAEPVALPAAFADEVAVAVRAVLDAIEGPAERPPRYPPEEFTWSPTA